MQICKPHGLYQRTLFYTMDFMAFEQLNTTDPIYHIFLYYTFDANNIFIVNIGKDAMRVLTGPILSSIMRMQ